MELTVGELREARIPLIKIMTAEQPFKLAYRLKKIAKTLETELREIEKVRIEKVKKYGTVLPDGNLQVIGENLETFQKEMEEINNTKINLEIQPIPLEGCRLAEPSRT